MAMTACYIPAGAQAGALPTEVRSLAPMLKRVTPAVVNISTRTRIPIHDNPLLRDPIFRRFFDLPERPRAQERQSLGSGVIIDARHGYIVTNHHVIDKADEITVTLHDGRTYEARVIGSDPASDIAVIQIDAEELRSVPLGDSEQVQVGDFVAAIGNPFGLNQTVTSGIVSAVGRTGLGIEGYEDFIQTDASINPGNSGGALVDLDGRLIGINTAILGPSGANVGIGFAIPVNMVRKVVDQLVRYGEVHRGQLGVRIQDLTPDLAKAMGLTRHRGALVAYVQPDSPAHKAGLRQGDLIVRLGDQPIESAADLRNAVGVLRAGAVVEVVLIRGGKRLTRRVRLEEPAHESLDAGEIDLRLGGLIVGEIGPNHPLYGRTAGVLVLGVKARGPAVETGLEKGDIITSVNRRGVRDLAGFRDLIQSARGRLLLHVQRGDTAFFLLLR